jgi:hypothetical protein
MSKQKMPLTRRQVEKAHARATRRMVVGLALLIAMVPLAAVFTTGGDENAEVAQAAQDVEQACKGGPDDVAAVAARLRAGLSGEAREAAIDDALRGISAVRCR